MAGIFFLAANNLTNAYANTANRGSEIISQDAPSSLKELQNADEEQLDYWASNLAKFDGRNFDYITPARDQTVNRNTCWAFAAVGAVEASILREGIDITATRENLDFDETIAAYTRHTRKGDEDPLLLTANDTYDYGKWNQGDNAVNAFAIMTQGYTLVKENHFHTSVSESDIRDNEARTSNEEIKRLTAERARVQREIDNAVNLLVSGVSPEVVKVLDVKIVELKTLLNDLSERQAALELEQGLKVTKADIVAFVEEFIKGDVRDKDFQKRIIENLVRAMYVYDDEVVLYFNVKGGREESFIGKDDTDAALSGAGTPEPPPTDCTGGSVQTLTPPLRHVKSTKLIQF